MNAYRDRIYANYASLVQDAAPEFNPDTARRWGRAYDFYFKGWLPSDKNASIVDLACGGGGMLFFFKERGYSKISGVDVSPSQVKLARQVVPDVSEGSVFEFLESRAGQFDFITGLDIVEHFTKDEGIRFLDGCRNALKPGGRLVLQTPNADSPLIASVRYGDFTHEVCFNPNSLGRLLKICGFAAPECREMGPPKGYGAAATLRGWLWRILRLKLMLWNRIETGNSGSGVFTRVFAVSAIKPQ